MNTLCITDVGSTTTKAILIKHVDGEYRLIVRGEAPTTVEAESGPFNDESPPKWSIVRYEFPARGDRPPVTLKWYEKGFDVPPPRRWEEGKALPEEGGMYMEGTKETLYHAEMRPTSPIGSHQCA